MYFTKQKDHIPMSKSIAASLRGQTSEIKVADVRIGLGYTAVLLEDGRAGVAYTFREQAKGGCSVFRALRPLVGRRASELLPLVESRDAIEAAVGLATANAFANQNGGEYLTGDILEYLEPGSNDRVGMVGHFAPMVRVLKEKVRRLDIYETIDEPQGELRPMHEVFDNLQHCQIALITATSIINHTIDGLLQAAGRCKKVVVLGASTPLLPKAFDQTNVSLLSGVLVEDSAGVLRVVSEGGGMRQFKPYIRKVNLVLPERR